MTKVWMDYAFASARLCHEAQEVMSLRLTKLAQGGTRSRAEAQLMVTEKGFALTEALVTLATGGSMQTELRRYRGHVRTNKRRLSRPKRGSSAKERGVSSEKEGYQNQHRSVATMEARVVSSLE